MRTEELYRMVRISMSLIWSNGSIPRTADPKISWKTKAIRAPPLSSSLEISSLVPWMTTLYSLVNSVITLRIMFDYSEIRVFGASGKPGSCRRHRLMDRPMLEALVDI